MAMERKANVVDKTFQVPNRGEDATKESYSS